MYSETYDELVADVSACTTLESLICGKGVPKPPTLRVRRRLTAGREPRAPTEGTPFNTYERVSTVVKACRSERKRVRQEELEVETSDETLCKHTRFTDSLALANYAPFLHYVPRLVNIVRLLVLVVVLLLVAVYKEALRVSCYPIEEEAVKRKHSEWNHRD